MKTRKKIVSILLTFMLLISLMPTALAAESSYQDTDGHWAEAAIERWSGYGVIQGNNGSFNPNGSLTRAHMAAVLSRLLNLPEAPDAGFADVKEGDWHAEYINKCAAAGIMLGSDGKANPNAPITRQQAIVMLGRALGIQPVENPDLSNFQDGTAISDYAKGYVAAMNEAGIVGGITSDTLGGGSDITRAQTVTILNRAIGTYANEAGTTVEASSSGITLVAADNVTVTGTADSVLVSQGAQDGTVTLSSGSAGSVTVTAENATVYVTSESKADNVTLTETAVDSKVVVLKGAEVGTVTTAAPGSTVSVSGKVDTVATTATAEKASVEVAKNATVGEIAASGEKTAIAVSGKVENVTVSDTATDTTVKANSGSTISKVDNAAEGTTVSGSGKVENVTTSGDNTTVSTPGTKVEADKGTTGTTAGGKDVAGGSSTTTKPSTPSGGGSSSGGSSHSHSYSYTDNGDGTHTGKCYANDSTLAPAAHTYTDGKCTVCGAEAEGKTASVKNTEGVIHYYDNLADAITAAGAGDIVYLLKDVATTDNGIDLSEKTGTVSVDGKGHIITLNHTAFNGVGADNLEGIQCNLTVKNTVFQANNVGQGYVTCAGFDYNGAITLDNCKFKDMYTAVYCNPNSTATKFDLTITNCVYDNTTWGCGIDYITVPAKTVAEQVNLTFTDNTGIEESKVIELFEGYVGYKDADGKYCTGKGHVAGTSAELEEAIGKATSTDVVVLQQDISLDETLIIDKSVTINLNGKNIIGDGVRAIQVKSGTLKLDGVGTVSSTVENVDSSVIRVGDNNATKSAYLYVYKGVTISTATAYGITAFGNKYEYVYVYGKVTSTAPENTAYDGCAIATLGTDTTKSYIYIRDGATVSAANTNAIYMPSGNLTVEGGTITGRTGIYVKSGSTTIKGGTITGNGTAVAYNYYGNGGISTGDALVVDSCGYPRGVPSVTVSGGTFTSVNANAVASYNTDGNTLVTGFVKGGTFSSNPSDYVPFGYKTANAGNTWSVSEVSSTAEEPIHITSEADWLGLASRATSSDTTTGQYYVVDKDLDFTGVTQKAGLKYFAGNIDFQGHTISGLNGSNTYTDRYPSLFKIVKAGATIKNLKYELPNLGTDYTVKPIGSIEGTGTVTLENIAISGNLNMTDNNTGLLVDFIGGNSKFDGNVNLIGCTSTCNMVNNGYSSVFIGGIYRYDNNVNDGNQITLNAKDCVNYGKILSTGERASMLISNGTRHGGDNLTLNITNCRNEGQIIAGPGKSSYLAMPDMGNENSFYSADQIKAFETSGAIVNGNSGITASLNAGELAVVEGKFDLTAAKNKVPGATRFELAFGFQGTGGLGGGGVTQYAFSFDSREAVVNVPAYSWVNVSAATGTVTAHDKYGTTYYTDEANHYVYNLDGYLMNNQPEVSFVAYDVEGNVMLVDFYTYAK